MNECEKFLSQLSKEDLELDRTVRKVIDCHKEVNTFVMPTDQSAPIKEMEKRVQTLQNKLQNFEEKTRNCPRCNDSMTLDEYLRLTRKSSSESWLSDRNGVPGAAIGAAWRRVTTTRIYLDGTPIRLLTLSGSIQSLRTNLSQAGPVLDTVTPT